jgi:bZIP factor
LITEHKITGDVLCMLDPEGLKALGVSSVGQRLCILKCVYLLKLAQDIPLDPEHYVPPCK